MHKTLKMLLAATTAATILALAACGGGESGGSTNPPPVDNTPASITLSPGGALSLQAGATATLTPTVTAKSGSTLNPLSVSWSSADASIASVSAGIVTAGKVGTTTITASMGSVSATTTVTVTAGAAATLGVRTQPIGALSGATLATQPVIEIRDLAGNLVTSSTAAVTVAIGSGGGTLGGTVTVNAVGGVATFSGLSITGLPGDRTLTFTAAGLTSTTSAAFSITPPPVAVIGVDASTVSLSTLSGSNPAAAKINITNGGTVAISGLAVDQPTYDGGTATGWLAASLAATTAPTVLTLTVAAAALPAGNYHATLRLSAPGATNSPVTIGVSLVVNQSYSLSYGGATDKVKILDLAGTFLPPTTLVNTSGAPVTGVTVTYASRASSVVTVASDGRLTAKTAGDAWIVATTPLSVDSIFVIVPQNATGPIIRSNITNYAYKLGDTAFVTVYLDTRATPVGAAVLAVDDETPAVGLFSTPAGPPTPVVTLTPAGVIRISVGTATGMTGTITVLNLKLTSRTAAAGYVYLYGLDLSAVDGTSLTLQTTSTRLPIIFR